MAAENHFCSLPRTFREQFDTSAPFLKKGVSAGEKCVYIADDNPVELVRAELASCGLAVRHLEGMGSLLIVPSEQTPLRSGAINPEFLYHAWNEAVDAAVFEGFQGLRVVAEMTWTLDKDIEDLVRYEAGAAELFARKPLTALCQYNRNLFTEDAVRRAAARTHKHMLLEGGRISGLSPEQTCLNLGIFS